MTSAPNAAGPAEGTGDRRLAILLAMAMFVLVVDTSLMNVSISAVVHDLDTTVSGVQAAIALDAFVVDGAGSRVAVAVRSMAFAPRRWEHLRRGARTGHRTDRRPGGRRGFAS
jgi:hypothetical protein